MLEVAVGELELIPLMWPVVLELVEAAAGVPAEQPVILPQLMVQLILGVEVAEAEPQALLMVNTVAWVALE